MHRCVNVGCMCVIESCVKVLWVKVRVCVCVKHLNRCKTSNSCFGFFSNCVNFKAGGRGDLQSSAQRSSLQASQEARTDHPCVPARL